MTETCPECRDTHCDCQRVAQLEAENERLKAVLCGLTDWAYDNSPGRCGCHEAYTSRKMTDPHCAWCQDDWITGTALINDAKELLQGNQK